MEALLNASTNNPAALLLLLQQARTQIVEGNVSIFGQTSSGEYTQALNTDWRFDTQYLSFFALYALRKVQGEANSVRTQLIHACENNCRLLTLAAAAFTDALLAATIRFARSWETHAEAMQWMDMQLNDVQLDATRLSDLQQEKQTRKGFVGVLKSKVEDEIAKLREVIEEGQLRSQLRQQLLHQPVATSTFSLSWLLDVAWTAVDAVLKCESFLDGADRCAETSAQFLANTAPSRWQLIGTRAKAATARRKTANVLQPLHRMSTRIATGIDHPSVSSLLVVQVAHVGMCDIAHTLLSEHSELYDTAPFAVLMQAALSPDTFYPASTLLPVTHLFTFGIDVVHPHTGECTHILARQQLQQSGKAMQAVDIPSIESAFPAMRRAIEQPHSDEEKAQQCTHFQRAVIQEWRNHSQRMYQHLLQHTPLLKDIIVHILAAQLALDLTEETHAVDVDVAAHSTSSSVHSSAAAFPAPSSSASSATTAAQ